MKYENELDGLRATRARWPQRGEALFSVMGGAGDHRALWDPSRPDEVAAARSAFDRLRGKGYLAYKVDKQGERGKQISEFDPAAGKLILAPPMQGG